MTNLSLQIMNIKDVIEFTRLSRSTIYELCNPKSEYFDASFPKQVKLTQNRVGWLAEEINDWIQSKIDQRDQ